MSRARRALFASGGTAIAMVLIVVPSSSLAAKGGGFADLVVPKKLVKTLTKGSKRDVKQEFKKAVKNCDNLSRATRVLVILNQGLERFAKNPPVNVPDAEGCAQNLRFVFESTVTHDENADFGNAHFLGEVSVNTPVENIGLGSEGTFLHASGPQTYDRYENSGTACLVECCSWQGTGTQPDYPDGLFGSRGEGFRATAELDLNPKSSSVGTPRQVLYDPGWPYEYETGCGNSGHDPIAHGWRFWWALTHLGELDESADEGQFEEGDWLVTNWLTLPPYSRHLYTSNDDDGNTTEQTNFEIRYGG